MSFLPIFFTTRARTVNAPVINEILLSLECELVHSVTVGSHTQLTGEVKNIIADGFILNNKDRIMLDKLKPIIYNEEEVIYMSVGEKVSDAFKPDEEIVLGDSKEADIWTEDDSIALSYMMLM